MKHCICFEICNKWSKRINCYKNQCASGWHINISLGDVSLSIAITGLWAPDKDLVNFIETNIGNKNPGVRGSLL